VLCKVDPARTFNACARRPQSVVLGRKNLAPQCVEVELTALASRNESGLQLTKSLPSILVRMVRQELLIDKSSQITRCRSRLQVQMIPTVPTYSAEQHAMLCLGNTGGMLGIGSWTSVSRIPDIRIPAAKRSRHPAGEEAGKCQTVCVVPYPARVTASQLDRIKKVIPVCTCKLPLTLNIVPFPAMRLSYARWPRGTFVMDVRPGRK
jgi:hypothetical protein